MRNGIQDLRYAARQLRKSLEFTLTAIFTLAMAIGANAVVFGCLNGLVLHPLDVPHAETFYDIEQSADNVTEMSYLDYVDIRDRNSSFDDLVAFDIPQVGLDTGEGPSPVWGMAASGNYFDGLGIKPYLGRFFHALDERGPNSAPYIVLSYGYWHSHFQDDRGVVGRVVQVNKHPYTIIGVAPPQFRGTFVYYSPSFFVPLVQSEQVWGGVSLTDRAGPGIGVAEGHLKAGVTPAQAVSDLNAIGAWLQKTYPRAERRLHFRLVSPGFWGDITLKKFVVGLMFLAGLILLAACANLGSLFAARASERSREVALRLALGSSRKRILRGLFMEGLLISLTGGAVGLGASVALLRWLSVWQAQGNLPMYTPVRADAAVYAVAVLLAVISGFLSTAVPVREVLRTNPYEVIKSSPSSGSGKRLTPRDFLVLVQITICAVLISSSIVAVRGLVRSLHEHLGFSPQNTLVATIDPHMAGYEGDRVPILQRRMLDAIERIPGVEAVGMSDPLLLYDTYPYDVFRETATRLSASNAAANAYMYRISPNYLRAEGTVLLAGRTFTWHDDHDSPRVAIVNQEFARRVFASAQGAVGKHYKMPDGTRVEVVGVAEDGRYSTLAEDPRAAMFMPIPQWPPSRTISISLVVRSARGPESLAAAIRLALQQLDGGLTIQVNNRYTLMAVALFGPQTAAVALGVFGAMGAMLSFTGIFGLAAYMVSRRMRELGIRVALGAQRIQVLKSALGRAFRLLAFGSAAGLGIGLLTTRVLALIVYRATPGDPLVLAGVVLAMLAVGLAASWMPARRALKVNPMSLLREE
jgi:predicted permease